MVTCLEREREKSGREAVYVCVGNREVPPPVFPQPRETIAVRSAVKKQKIIIIRSLALKRLCRTTLSSKIRNVEAGWQISNPIDFA